MGRPKELKSQSDRLQEGITLLNQLKDAGVKDHTMTYLHIKQRISYWVRTGEPYEDTMDAPEFGRVAELVLPRYTNRIAEIRLKNK